MTRAARRRSIGAISGAFLMVGLTGCGNWISVSDAGQMGLTVDASGHPVIAVVTCAKATPVITMYEGRKKSDPEDKKNVERGGWQARRAFSGVQKLAVDTPGPGWKTTQALAALEPGRLFIADGGTVEDSHASLGGVSFRTEELTTLNPDTVQVNGKPMTLSKFAAYRCD